MVAYSLGRNQGPAATRGVRRDHARDGRDRGVGDFHEPECRSQAGAYPVSHPWSLGGRWGAGHAWSIYLGGTGDAPARGGRPVSDLNPSVVARQVHTPFLILGVWVAGGALAMLGAFIWAELATRLPGAGGQYLYLREAYHPAVAFVYGWVLLLVTQTGGMAAVAVTFARYYREISGVTWSDSAIAAAGLPSLSAINCLEIGRA